MALAEAERLHNALQKHLVRQDEITLVHQDGLKRLVTFKARPSYILPELNKICVVVTEGRDAATHFCRGEEVTLHFTQEGLTATSVIVQEMRPTAELMISYPYQCHAQERREKERIYSPNLLVRFQGKVSICKNCYDFGPGGFAVLFQKKEYIPCQIEEQIHVELFLQEKFINLNATLVNIAKIDVFENHNYPYGGQRASFRWDNLIPADRILLKEMMQALAVKGSSFAESEESDPPRSLVLVK